LFLKYLQIQTHQMASKSSKENNPMPEQKKIKLRNQKPTIIPQFSLNSIYYIQETNLVRRFYLSKIGNYELSKSKSTYRPKFLQGHKITPEIRARMVR
jgi:hypothetical protein